MRYGMKLRSIIQLSIFAIMSATAFAQDVPQKNLDPTPIPNSASKRRGFDQFDLPNGVSLPTPAERPALPGKTAGPAVVEQLDPETYDGVIRMIDYASRVEKEYRATSTQEHDPREYYSADNVLKRKSNALFSILELYRTGLFGNRLSNEQNLKLLKENQKIIGDIHAVFGLVPDDKALYTARLRVLAENYLPKPANRTEMAAEKNLVLGAMLARMNENFTRLKASVEVGN